MPRYSKRPVGTAGANASDHKQILPLVIDLDEEPGRTARVKPSDVATIFVQLSTCNASWEELMDLDGLTNFKEQADAGRDGAGEMKRLGREGASSRQK
jgi:hypothetical protein